MPRRLRLLLVEDHVLVRQSIRAFLQGEGFDVVGEASSGTEGVQLALDLNPDLVIMDVHLPGISGIEATRRIRQERPQTHIVALTAYNEKVYQRALAEAGADAFVLKTVEFTELLAVIQTVMSDKAELPSGAKGTGRADAGAAHPLTERELEVLSCVARGWTNKQIGQHLGISDRTVQVHLQAIFHKLSATSRTEAVLRALMMGIITPPDGGLA